MKKGGARRFVPDLLVQFTVINKNYEPQSVKR